MFPITIIKTILDYAGAHKNVVKLKIPYWQTFGASGIGCAALVGLGWLFYTFIYIPGFQIIGFYPIFGVTIVLFIVMLMLVYYPITAYMGGWDDENLEAFHKAAQLSGPSKFLVWPLYKIVSGICKHLPLHNKFRMPSEEAFKEAAELLELKRSHQTQNVLRQLKTNKICIVIRKCITFFYKYNLLWL